MRLLEVLSVEVSESQGIKGNRVVLLDLTGLIEVFDGQIQLLDLPVAVSPVQVPFKETWVIRKVVDRLRVIVNRFLSLSKYLKLIKLGVDQGPVEQIVAVIRC